jgi:hypothetical protein
MARVIRTKLWLLVELERARAVWPDIKRWLLVELERARTDIKRWLLVESERARAVWPDIKSSFEFKIALLLFVISTVVVAVLGLVVRR